MGIAAYFTYPQLPLAAVGVLLGLSLLIYLTAHARKWYRTETIGLYLSLFILGYTNGALNYQHHYPAQLKGMKSYGYVYLRIDKMPAFKNEQYQVDATIVGVEDSGQIVGANGSARLFFHWSNCGAPTVGQIISVKREYLKPPNTPGNPFEFNYASYLASQQQYYVTYLYPNTWHQLNLRDERLIDKIYQLRYELGWQIKTLLKDAHSAAVAQAMILGDRSGLDSDLTAAYASTGSIHVLAVSGLHVGIIFLVLLWLCKRLPKSWPAIVPIGIILIGLALYALLTGLAPSALRASVMFAFLSVTQFSKLRNQSLNALAASALLLLLITPNLILQMGFWLSYLAVTGILLLYRPIYSQLYVRNKVLNWFWQLTAVSLAAQIPTLPITAYFFHQMPLSGLLTNLVAVPAAFLTVTGGLVMLVVAKIKLLGIALGFALNWLLVGLNSFILWISSFSLSHISGIYMPWYSFVLLSLLVIAIMIFMMNRGKQALLVALSCMVVLNGINIMRQLEQRQQQQLVVYHMGKQTVVDLLTGTYDYSYQIPDSIEQQKLDRKVQPYRSCRGIRQVHQAQQSFFTVNNLRIGVQGKLQRRNIPQHRIPLDYLIIQKGYTGNIEQLEALYDVPNIIINSSNHPSHIDGWLIECDYLGLRAYDATKQAVIIDLDEK